MKKKIIVAAATAWCLLMVGCLSAGGANYTGSVSDFEKEYKNYLYDANNDGAINRLDYVVGAKDPLNAVGMIDPVYFGVVSGLKSLSTDSITPEELLKTYSQQLYDRNLDGVIDEDDYLTPGGEVRSDYYEMVKQLMQTNKSGAEYTEELKKLAEEERKEAIDDLRGEEYGMTMEQARGKIYNHIYSSNKTHEASNTGTNAFERVGHGLNAVILEYAYKGLEGEYDVDGAISLSDHLLSLAQYTVKYCEKAKIDDDETIKAIAKVGFDEFLKYPDIDEAKSAIRLAIATQAITAGSGNEKLEKIKEGGFDYYSADVNQQVNTLYEYMFPIGVAIMLVAWALGILKTGMTNSFSLADKYSVVNALLRLMIGVVVMCSLGEMLSLGMSASQTMCNSLYNKLSAGLSTSVNFNFFSKFIRYTLMLNMVALAVLQGIAPLFAGFCVLEQKKPAMNFLREYCKCLLVPPITIVYTVMATKMLDGFDSTNLSYIAKVVGALVLSIACINSAKKIVQGLIQ